MRSSPRSSHNTRLQVSRIDFESDHEVGAEIEAALAKQVEMRATLLRSVLPPVLIIILSILLIGLFVVALGLPLFMLLQGISGF